MSFIDTLRANAVNPIPNQNLEMGVIQGSERINNGRNQPTWVVSDNSKKLLRTKSHPQLEHNALKENRKRSLYNYSDTLFDLSVY